MTDIEIAYNKALDYLYSFVDYSLKHISELAKAEFNLDRMFALMEALGNPGLLRADSNQRRTDFA
jgi:dihydrofolate synthase/folylpolyglutamate synthase